jgi:hypothetical protein
MMMMMIMIIIKHLDAIQRHSHKEKISNTVCTIRHYIPLCCHEQSSPLNFSGNVGTVHIHLAIFH